MFWDKKKYTISIVGGRGQFNTEKMRGLVEHLIIKPGSKDTAYNIRMTDKDGDDIYDKRYMGRVDDKDGLPIGKDTQEKVSVFFTNVSKNDVFDVIFITREIG